MKLDYQSQLNQDAWVAKSIDFMRGGYFIEIGACAGIEMSNTYVLEKELGWSGICVEPSPSFYKDLIKNRTCITTDVAIYGRSGLEVDFAEAGLFGGIDGNFGEDKKIPANSPVGTVDCVAHRNEIRMKAERVKVKTLSLADLLKKHEPPKTIDYMSIDTEGTELDIIRDFDFNSYNIRLLTIEHNQSYRSDDYLNKIIRVMSRFGYEHRKEKWDVWFWRGEFSNSPSTGVYN